MNSDAFLEFEDLLQRHNYKFSNFQFAFKSYDPWSALIEAEKAERTRHASAFRGNNRNKKDVQNSPKTESMFSNPPSGDDVKKKVLNSPAVDHAIRSLKLESNEESEEQLRKRARDIVDMMAHNQTYSWARTIAGSLYFIMKRTFNNIFVNAGAFEQIKELFNKGPVVFLPSHRSYMDFLLVSVILFAYDLPIPVIAAAIDFLGMKFVGELLRRCGAFFIRRSFKTDKLYWTIFYEYVQTHLHAAKFPIEFFIEGTRSRTGNFLYPKSGMLNVVCQDFFKGRVTDVFFVPVSISYERLFEESLYAFELATGLPKPKESTSGMLKARKVLDENFGNIYINFGQPFSLREAAYNRVDRSRFACTPLFDQFVSEESELFVQELSLYAIARIQENIYIQPWHLIASVLFNYAFCNHNRALPAMLLVEKVNQLSNLLKNVNCKQIMTSHSLTDVISVLECHHKTVHFCTFSKMFLLAPEELYFTKEGKTVPIIPVQLLMYQNMFVNHLAPLFIAVNIVECQGSFISKQEFDHKWKLALSIFTQEFVAIENDPIQVLEVLESQKVTFYDTRSEIISLNLESYKLKNLLNDVARPYFTILYLTVANLYSYSLVSQSIGEYKFDSLASLNSSVRSKITQCYDSGKLSGVAAVTTAAVNNVFNLCKSRNIIVTKKKQGTTIIQVDQSKCSNLLNEIQQIFPCDQFMFAMSSIKSKL